MKTTIRVGNWEEANRTVRAIAAEQGIERVCLGYDYGHDTPTVQMNTKDALSGQGMGYDVRVLPQGPGYNKPSTYISVEMPYTLYHEDEDPDIEETPMRQSLPHSFELEPGTLFVSPFDLRIGDLVVNTPGSTSEVSECSAQPTTIGDCLADRQDDWQPENGDRYRVMFRDRESGISGRWDGESGFIIVDPDHFCLNRYRVANP